MEGAEQVPSKLCKLSITTYRVTNLRPTVTFTALVTPKPAIKYGH